MSRSIAVRKKMSAGCLIPFGLVFLVMGLGVGWFAWAKILTRVVEVRGWTETPCRVTAWEVLVKPGGKNVYEVEAKVAYEFESGGQTRTATTYDAAMGSQRSINEMEEEGAKARGGRGPMVCYVNPGNPEEATLIRPGYAVGGAVLAGGLLFAGLGALLTLGGIVGVMRRTAGMNVGGGRGGRGCVGTVLAPVAFAMFAVAGFVVWKLALKDQPDWEAVGARMVEVPGRILASGVSMHRSSGKNASTTWSAKVAWEFEWQGRTWRSGWRGFDKVRVSSGNQHKAERLIQPYPAGKTLTGWVDPEAPWQAVLVKESSSKGWLWIFPILFGGIGVLGLGWWLLKLVALGTALGRRG